MTKNIYQVATEFERKLRKLAQSNFPSEETVIPIIKSTLKSTRENHPDLLNGLNQVSNVDVQNSIDNTCAIYLQLVFEPSRYEQLLEESSRNEVVSILKSALEQNLANYFKTFNFRVKIGFVPL